MILDCVGRIMWWGLSSYLWVIHIFYTSIWFASTIEVKLDLCLYKLFTCLCVKHSFKKIYCLRMLRIYIDYQKKVIWKFCFSNIDWDGIITYSMSIFVKLVCMDICRNLTKLRMVYKYGWTGSQSSRYCNSR